MNTEINEPIEIAVKFKSGKAEPLIFRWHQNLFKIKKINLMHKVQQGEDLLYSYSVSTDKDDTYQISFNPKQLKWILDQTCD